METPQVDRQYSTGLSRHNIEQALVATGKDRKHIRPADLGVLEDFHTLGRTATRQLAEITSHDRVLDADSGNITAGTTGELDYPLPWADQPELSHLASADELRSFIETAGLNLVQWNDLTEQAASLMESFLSAPRAPLGLHTFIDNFAEKANNLTRGLASGRLRVIQGVARVTA